MVIQMKTVLLGINSKYIHTNLAIRLLKANCSYDVDIKEFTIKDEFNKIIDYITNYDILGISCYIWNANYLDELIPLIKKTYPKMILIIGGPEASYNYNHYLEIGIDYVIRNEGEIAFNMLINALHLNLGLEEIPNLVYDNHVNKLEEIKDLSILNNGYELENDYKNRITYIETSRGCPYLCSYCMASLEKSVRFFNLDEIKKTIIDLMNKGVKVFKFLDRTFNSDKKKALELFEFIIKNHVIGTSFQFEITGDILPPEIIDYLNNNAPKKLFRFEIGIQSTNINTNKLVKRIQNNDKLFSNIKKIQEKGIIDLHLDLIAGLPKEDLLSFNKTFDDVMSLYPLELQLGFLKLLRGTNIYIEKDLYNYKFSATAPYEIISNDSLSIDDIKHIHNAEEVLEKYYNSHFMNKTINYIIRNIPSCFRFFMEYGDYYSSNFSWINYHLDDLFLRLYNYLKMINFDNLEYILFLMKYDYLSHYKIKPKIWWEKQDKKKKIEIINFLKDNYLINYSLDDLYRYLFVEKYIDSYILVFYKPNNYFIEMVSF